MKRIITNQGVQSVPFGEQVAAQIMCQVLTEHRNKLIMQVTAALENYVEWRFKIFPTVTQVRVIRNVLEQLKDCHVCIQDLPDIFEEIQHTDVVILPDEPFEEFIDNRIAQILEQGEIFLERYF